MAIIELMTQFLFHLFQFQFYRGFGINIANLITRKSLQKDGCFKLRQKPRAFYATGFFALKPNKNDRGF